MTDPVGAPSKVSVPATTAVVLAIPAQLTYQTATQCLAVLKRSMEQSGILDAKKAAAGAVVVLDAQPLTTFDSSALAVLLECRRFALSHQVQMCIQSLPANLRSLANLYGVDGLLPAPPAGVTAGS